MRVIVDPISDANGFYTIRWDNGTENGDTESQPVATVYDYGIAIRLAALYNASTL
jgi:hypothetical protein